MLGFLCAVDVGVETMVQGREQPASTVEEPSSPGPGAEEIGAVQLAETRTMPTEARVTRATVTESAPTVMSVSEMDTGVQALQVTACDAAKELQPRPGECI